MEIISNMLLRFGGAPDEMGGIRDGLFHLLIVHFGVFSVLLQKLVMGALLHDMAVVDDGDGVGIHDRAQAVCDDDRRAAFEDVLQGGLDGGFGL